jgi:hypothetical protein
LFIFLDAVSGGGADQGATGGDPTALDELKQTQFDIDVGGADGNCYP